MKLTKYLKRSIFQNLKVITSSSNYFLEFPQYKKNANALYSIATNATFSNLIFISTKKTLRSTTLDFIVNAFSASTTTAAL